MTHEPGLLDVLRFYFHAGRDFWHAITADRSAFVILVFVVLASITWIVGAAADRKDRR